MKIKENEKKKKINSITLVSNEEGQLFNFILLAILSSLLHPHIFILFYDYCKEIAHIDVQNLNEYNLGFFSSIVVEVNV